MSFDHFLVWLLNAIQKKRKRPRKPGDLVLGVSSDRNSSNPFVIFPAGLRNRHLHMVGLTGTGKSYFIEHLIRQDIKSKTGFVVFDVHGDLATNIIRYLAERAPFEPEAYKRTVIIEPFDTERSFGFNPLEQSPHTSAYRQAQEFGKILRKRWQETALGARTEELLRNSLYTLSVNDQTLLCLPDLLTEKRVRDELVRRLPSTPIKQYWTQRYDRLSAKLQASFREPVLTRISPFIADPKIRDIVGQKKTTFSFRDAMQQGLWVIINLSTGRLGEENSKTLGSMLFTKLELEVMSLATVPKKRRKLFTVYADELQNLTGDTFGRLVAEARKYKVALVAGHQFWHQLDPSLRQAMLAVGSKVFFRLHYQDAVELAGELAANQKLRYIPLLSTLGSRGDAVVRVGNKRPVRITVPAHPSAKPTEQELQKLKKHSAERYTIPRVEIHKHIGELRQQDIQEQRGNQRVRVLN